MNSFHTGLYSLNNFPPGNAAPCGAFRELCLFHPDFDRWPRTRTGSAAYSRVAGFWGRVPSQLPPVGNLTPP